MKTKKNNHLLCIFLLILTATTVPLQACAKEFLPTAARIPPASDTLTLYNWIDYMPQSVMEAFTQEYGIKINYIYYESQEEAVDNIRAGKAYDLVVLPPELIPALIKDESLARIDYRNVLNFKNTCSSFRDLSFDPGNQYSIPFHWGTTGLLYRTDLVQKPVLEWADLWDPEFAGRVAIWPISRAVIPITLKSLGYPANSEDPAQLQEALERMLRLRQNSFLVSNDNSSIVPMLAEGKAVIGFGWAYDALMGQDLPIEYVIPKEGGILWSDHFVIPAASRNKRSAELFLNFILRPEISGQIINESYYPMANDAAGPFVAPEILNNPIVYPPQEVIKNSELTLALSPEGLKLYDEIWQKFLNAGSP